MIKVNFEQKSNGLLRLTMHGHAEKDGKKRDDVCAACTALAYTLAQCFVIMESDDKMQNKVRHDIRSGEAAVQAFPKDEYYNEAVQTFWTVMVGLSMIAHNYPDLVEVKEDIKPIEG